MSFFNMTKSRSHQGREFLERVNSLLATSTNKHHNEQSLALVLQSLESFCESEQLESVLDILLKIFDPDHACFLKWIHGNSDEALLLLPCQLNDSSYDRDNGLFSFSNTKPRPVLKSFLEKEQYFGLICHYLFFLSSLLHRPALDTRSKLLALWTLSRIASLLPTDTLAKVLPGLLSSLFKLTLQLDSSLQFNSCFLMALLQALDACMLREQGSSLLGQAIKSGITSSLFQSLLWKWQSLSTHVATDPWPLRVLLRFLFKLLHLVPYELTDSGFLLHMAFHIGCAEGATRHVVEDSMALLTHSPALTWPWMIERLELLLREEQPGHLIQVVSLALLSACLPLTAQSTLTAALAKVSRAIAPQSATLLLERWATALLLLVPEQDILQEHLALSDWTQLAFLKARETSDSLCDLLFQKYALHAKQEALLEWTIELLLDTIEAKHDESNDEWLQIERESESEREREHDSASLSLSSNPMASHETVALKIKNIVTREASSVWNPISEPVSCHSLAPPNRPITAMMKEAFLFLASRPALLKRHQAQLLFSSLDWLHVSPPLLQATLLAKENWPCLGHAIHQRLSIGNWHQALRLLQLITRSQSQSQSQSQSSVELTAFIQNESHAVFKSASLLLACSQSSQLPTLALHAFEFLRLLYALFKAEPDLPPLSAPLTAEGAWIPESIRILRHYLSHENAFVRIQACRLLAVSALPCLASYEPEQSVQAGLLSLVHTLWTPSLTCIFHCQSSSELCAMLRVLLQLIRVGGHEFMKSRMQKELWPSLIRLLTRKPSAHRVSVAAASDAHAMISSTTDIQIGTLLHTAELYELLSELMRACSPSLQQSLMLYRGRVTMLASDTSSCLHRGLDYLTKELYRDAFFPILNHGLCLTPPSIQTHAIQLKPAIFDKEWTKFIC